MDNLEVQLPLFSNATVSAYFECKSPDELEPNERSVFAAFMALTPLDLKVATRHVAAYARECWAMESNMRAVLPLNIWKHVTPGPIFLLNCATSKTLFISMEAECSWESEHGLQMVWRNGNELCKVGPFNGHPTNVHAYSDPNLEGIVYNGINPRFSTKA